jgi:4-deoxy-L-threo-5-hexosulose-uronate ketol-isomerase
MEIRCAANPKDVKNYTNDRLREDFLIQGLFVPGEVKMVYSHQDRLVVGGAVPTDPVKLEAGSELRADFFLQRRELGIINIGNDGFVCVDGAEYQLENKDGIYIGMGSKEILLSSREGKNPAKFYFVSAPAHKSYPVEKIKISSALPQHLGSKEDANERTIYKYIHPLGVKSCQLVMGMTMLEPGSVWNTMPCHTHDRRAEVYLYFNMPQTALVFHFMGEPGETKHIAMRNEEAVISPSWSIHSGAGTRNYTFIWGMAGENQDFGDMDPVDMLDIK